MILSYIEKKKKTRKIPRKRERWFDTPFVFETPRLWSSEVDRTTFRHVVTGWHLPTFPWTTNSMCWVSWDENPLVSGQRWCCADGVTWYTMADDHQLFAPREYTSTPCTASRGHLPPMHVMCQVVSRWRCCALVLTFLCRQSSFLLDHEWNICRTKLFFPLPTSSSTCQSGWWLTFRLENDEEIF